MVFTQLSPDVTLLLFTAGVLLIYVELNRPGLILPGAAGLTLALLSAAHLLRGQPARLAVAALVSGFLLLAVATRTRGNFATCAVCGAASSTVLLYGFLHLGAGNRSPRPGTAVAVTCAVLLGIGTSLLTTIAAHARQNKRLGRLP